MLAPAMVGHGKLEGAAHALQHTDDLLGDGTSILALVLIHLSPYTS